MGARCLKLLAAHGEKLLLVLAALMMILIAMRSLLGTPHAIEFQGRIVRPNNLHDVVVSEAAALQEALRMARPTGADAAPYAELLRQRHRAGIDGLGSASLRRATEFGPGIGGWGLTIEQRSRVELVTPLPPTRPVAHPGRSLAYRTPLVINGAAPTNGGKRAAKTYWVTVAAYFDAAAQRAEMEQAGYPPYRARPYVVGVEAERQELLPGGRWDGWATVQASVAMPLIALPRPAFDDASGELLNRAEIDAAFARVKGAQRLLMQPPFYFVSGGDAWRLPLGDGERDADDRAEDQPSEPPDQPTDLERLRETLRAAEEAYRRHELARAEELARAVGEVDGAPANHRRRATQILHAVERELLRRRFDSLETLPDRRTLAIEAWMRDPHTDAPAVWFHDDTVEPGRTYRYRLRVRLWNRYAGRPGPLKHPADAARLTVEGAWSLPSAPVTVPRAMYYFLRGGRPAKRKAAFEVWKWHDGAWYRQAFEVTVGERIGGTRTVRTGFDADDRPLYSELSFQTDAVLLDVQVRHVGGAAGRPGHSVTVVTVLDPAIREARERSESSDRYDPLRRRLELDAAL